MVYLIFYCGVILRAAASRVGLPLGHTLARAIPPPLLASAILCVFLLLARSQLSELTLFSLAVLAGGTVVAYGLLMFTLVFESDERALIEKDVRKCRIQIQKNFAMAFSVLSLAIVGIPLGLRAGRSETHANIAIALVLAMAYYVLVVIVGWMENKPLLRPDLLVWIPNLIFQFSGACTLAIAAKK